MFADRKLNTVDLLAWASDLVGRGILRKGFARFLWKLEEQNGASGGDPHEMEPAKFEEILEEIGVTIPLPVDENTESNAPAVGETKSQRDSVGEGVDLLVIMRLPPEADAQTRENLASARQAALSSQDSDGGKTTLKAVFEFDHAGAPYGLPERVMALSHKVGAFSPAARWRLGGLFLLHSHSTSRASSMILEYDKEHKTYGIEALRQTPLLMQAMQFVISALFHAARDFPGASWTGWVERGMGHEGEKMYHLPTSYETQVIR